ncbi:MAG: CHAT domain-containing protein [Pleurocapsa sp.]
MKLFQLPIAISLVVSWSLVTSIADAQNRNMSDVTGVEPIEAGLDQNIDNPIPDNTGDNVVDSSPDNTGDNVVDPIPDNTGDNVVDPIPDNTGDNVVDSSPDNTGDNVVERNSSEDVSESKVIDSRNAEEESVTQNNEQKEETVTQEEQEEIVASDEEEEATVTQQEVSRDEYELAVQVASTPEAIETIEAFQVQRLMNSSGIETMYGQIPSARQISQRLGVLWQQTGKKAAFINISLQSDRLEAFVVLPTVLESAQNNHDTIASTKISPTALVNPPEATLRRTVRDVSRQELLATATQFRENISDSRKLRQTSYLESSQQLYQALIKPIEEDLEANDIDVLVFAMDSGLRLLPIAALYDGQQFLIEKYALALVPSFGLTDTRYVNLNQSRILAMGASEFPEQAPLPTMPIELETIVSDPRQGELFLNEQFTVDNFKAQNLRQDHFPIIHLGTHAEFTVGNLDKSYIQFYDDKLELSELRAISDELGWNTSTRNPVELLVLSACQTALGDERAELGFAGLAVQAGVKSALASLWYISDLGTLALMGEFYDQLGDTLIKAEALRQTQLAMLEGKVKVSDRAVQLSHGHNLPLPAEFPQGTLELSHPYFWSAFTLIGNWN